MQRVINTLFVSLEVTYNSIIRNIYLAYRVQRHEYIIKKLFLGAFLKCPLFAY